MKLVRQQVIVPLIIEAVAVLLAFLVVNVVVIANNQDMNLRLMQQLVIAFSLYAGILLLATADTFLLRLCVVHWHERRLALMSLLGALVCTAAIVPLAAFDPLIQGWEKNIFTYLVFGILSVMCAAIHAFLDSSPTDMNSALTYLPEPQAQLLLTEARCERDADV